MRYQSRAKSSPPQSSRIQIFHVAAAISMPNIIYHQAHEGRNTPILHTEILLISSEFAPPILPKA